MEIRHLKLIREVARKGSLTQAMDTLYLSQSALSHQLKEAEKQLGTPVFHRVNKKLVLTEAGKIMLEAAESILDQLDRATMAVKKYASGDTGTIRLATECYTCYHFLPTLMEDFNREFPKVNIEIHPEATMNPIQMIQEGKLDIAVSYEAFDNPNIINKELLTDELVALVPADHPWTKKPYVEAEDFADQQVMIHSFPLESVVLFRQVLIPAGVTPRKVIAIQVTEAVVDMVRAGMGIKVMTRWIVEPYLQDKRLAAVKVTKKGLYRTWYTTTLNRPDMPQYLENFECHLKKNIKGVCEKRSALVV